MKNTLSEYPLFTVIIPQKDRAEYMAHTLRTCMIQDYPNFEVIVSDDFSQDNSVEVIRSFAKKDSRIKLFAHTHHLGMRDNFEFALNQVRPGYVMALGGDDGLTPGCIWRMYEIINKTGKQLLTWAPATFRYSTFPGDKNIFYMKRTKDRTIKILKSKDFLNKIAKTFNYQIDECPMFYMKGVASTELVDRVKLRTKDHSFYYCPTPDGFSGVVLAGEVEDYVFTYEPLSISGASPKSQGLNYMRTDKKSREESKQFFNDNIRRSMHPELASQPYSPLQTLMTADYLLTARDLPGWPGQFESISFERLLRVTFKRLEKHSMSNEVLVRELKILHAIAIQHNLLDLFNELMANTKRKVVRNEPIYGFLLTNSIRFEGSKLGINNIFDAALATNFIYNFYSQISIKEFNRFIMNSFKVLLQTRQYKVESLPKLENK
ncbi:MAG: glycosyltransferase family 2 protein [Bacteroidales bacterium]